MAEKDDRLVLRDAIARGLKQRRQRMWEESVKRAIGRQGNGDIEQGLDQIAEALVKLAAMGEQWAIKEVGDRIDGKATQQVDIGVTDELPSGLEVTFRGKDPDRVPAETRKPLHS